MGEEKGRLGGMRTLHGGPRRFKGGVEIHSLLALSLMLAAAPSPHHFEVRDAMQPRHGCRRQDKGQARGQNKVDKFSAFASVSLHLIILVLHAITPRKFSSPACPSHFSRLHIKSVGGTGMCLLTTQRSRSLSM